MRDHICGDCPPLARLPKSLRDRGVVQIFRSPWITGGRLATEKASVEALCRILGRILGPPQVQRLAQSLHLWRCRVPRCGGATARGDFLQKRVDGSQISPVCGLAAAFFASFFSGTNLSCVWILQITWSIRDRPGNSRRR